MLNLLFGSNHLSEGKISDATLIFLEELVSVIYLGYISFCSYLKL